jgi:tRNA pseudouridine55 synthase
VILFGLLNVHKPRGLTSRDVVNHVQRQVRPVKVGHAGTLDPLATGVLIVCVGPATRLVEHVQQMRKRYRGTFLLGRYSPTEDIEGEITFLDAPPIPALEELLAAAKRLTGSILQRPPAFSALRVAGRRAYDLARSGQAVELEPREIAVYQLEIRRYEYPELELEIECSSGTYVRSLGRDLAELVGSAAVMSALERTAIGGFNLAESAVLEDLSAAAIPNLLIDPVQAVSELPQRTLSADELYRVQRGQFLPGEANDPSPVAALLPDGSLVALLELGARGYSPTKNFVGL